MLFEGGLCCGKGVSDSHITLWVAHVVRSVYHMYGGL